MNKEEKSYLILKTALEESKKLNNPSLIKSCIGNLILVHIDMEQWKEASQLYQEHIKYYDFKNMTASFDAYIARLHAKNNLFKEAFFHLNTGWSKARNLQDSINLYNAESRIHLMNKSWEESYRGMEKCITFPNKIIRESLQQPVLTVQKDFLKQELKYNEYKLRMEKYIRLLGFIILLLVSIIILAFLRKKFQKRLKEQLFLHEKKMEELQQEALKREESLRSYTNELETKSCLSKQDIDRLNQELEESKKHIEEARIFRDQISQEMESLKIDNHDALMRINKTLKNHFKQIENTYQVLQVKYKNAENRDKAIEEYMRNTTAEFYGSKKADRNLEKLVNELYGDTMRQLRKEIKLPAEEHYRLVCFLLAGLSINFIAALTGETTNAIYKRREKIRDIIKKSDSLNKSTYLLI